MKQRREFGKTVHIRVSPDEWRRWYAMADAEGVNLSDLVRRRLETAPVGRSPAPRKPRRRFTAPPELVQQVARQGNNLNQIARQLNVWAPLDRVAVLAALASIDQQLAWLLEAWTPGRGGGDAH